MSRPRHLSSCLLGTDVKRLYKRAKGDEQRRYLGLYHVQHGKTYPEVAALLLGSRQAVIDWVKKFEAGGEGRVVHQAGRGRNAKVSPAKRAVFQDRVLQW